MDTARSPWPAIRNLPWARIAIGSALALLLIAVVPPFRTAAATVTSRILLFVASPLAPDVEGFDTLGKASTVLAADGTEIGQLGEEQREPVPLAQLPPYVSKAVLAAEDARFYQHSGVDPSAVFRAAFNSATGGGVTGGSTLTQQLAKLNYTGSKRTVFRKLREVLYASKLESKYSKDQLLERYLNQVYFGHGAYGIGSAARTYFGISPTELTPEQAAMLAGKISAPNALDPYEKASAVAERRNHVLQAMKRHDWLSEAEVQAAMASPLTVAPDPESRSAAAARGPGRAPHFVAFVEREAAAIDALGDNPETRRKQILTGGYTVETTLDPKALDAARAAAEQILGQPGDPTTAIASVQPEDGAIRLIFGGLDPKQHFDPATQGRRQPGSSFKPFVYLAMLEKRIDPRSVFDSGSPKNLDCNGAPWPVENYEGKGGGPSTVDAAMAGSVNTVFAQIMVQVGPPAVQRVAEKAGISHEAVTPAECAMALGGLRRGVSPLEQATAFATFAAKGVRTEPYSITRIKDRNGKVIYEHKVNASDEFDVKQIGVLNGALKQVVDGGTGTAARIGRPLAGKTGTTDDNGNAWFVGFVPQLSTAVWVGHPEGDVPMTNVHGIEVTGGTFPAQIFGRYMRAAVAHLPVEQIFTASPDDLNLKSAVKPSTSVTVSVPEEPTTSTSPVEEFVLPSVPPFDTVPPPVSIFPVPVAPVQQQTPTTQSTPTPTTKVSPTTTTPTPSTVADPGGDGGKKN